MAPTLALSTSWLAHRHEDGYTLLTEVADLGFSHVELSHNIPYSLVKGILKAVKERVVQVSSVHNFCPIPEGYARGSPNLYKPTTWKFLERKAWLKYSLKSLEFAEQVGASALVCHMGSVDFFFTNPLQHLQVLAQARPPSALLKNRPYQEALQSTLKAIHKKELKALQRAKSCLEPLLEKAEKKAIVIGVENREGLLELPTESQLLNFIESFKSDYIGYWHDSGHAQIKAQWGLLEPGKHLAKHGQHLLGFHLHDTTIDGKDHQAIGSGTVDFQMLSTYIKPHHRLVLEFSPKVTKVDVLASREAIKDLIYKS